MPKLPDVTDFGERPQPSPGASVYSFTPSRAGQIKAEGVTSLGQGLRAAGNRLEVVYEEEKRKNDLLMSEDAENILLNKALDLEIGDDGYTKKKGAAATKGDLFKDYMQRFDDEARLIEDGLQNDEQRQMHRLRKDAVRRQYAEGVIRHSIGEREAEAERIYKATRAIEIKSAAARGNDPAAIASSLLRIEANTHREADRLGIPREGPGAEPRQLMLASDRSDVHIGVIEGLLASGQDRKAKVYADAVRQEIDGEDRVTVDRWLEEGSVQGEAQRLADTIAGQAGTLKEAMALAKAADPKIRAETENRLVRYYAIKEQDEKDVKERAFTEASNIVETMLDTNFIPRSTWDLFDVHEKAALETYAAKNAMEQPIRTDWTVWNDISIRAASPALRDELFSGGIMKYMPDLADKERTKLLEWQSKWVAGDTSIDPELEGYSIANKIINDTLAGKGQKVKVKDGSPEAAALANINTQVRTRIQEQTTEKKRRLNSDEVQSIVDDVIKTAPESSSWGDLPALPALLPMKVLSLLNPFGGAKTVADIKSTEPPPDLEKIKAALIGAGIQPTEDAINDMIELRNANK